MNTQEQMAVAIAEDVIKQIEAEQYHAFCGVYFEEVGLITQDSRPKTKDVLNKRCLVCALGSLVISAARLYNAGTYEVENRYFPIRDALRKYFSIDEIRLIESAFELMNMGAMSSQISEIAKAIKFGDMYKDNKERLKAIMTNIIENKGHFVV